MQEAATVQGNGELKLHALDVFDAKLTRSLVGMCRYMTIREGRRTCSPPCEAKMVELYDVVSPLTCWELDARPIDTGRF